MSNFLFIDDSGSKQWETPFADDFVQKAPDHIPANRNFWQGNYFVLAGVHVDSETIAELNPLINEAKERYFGDKNVEIHSVDLRNPHRQKRKYFDLYNITAEKLKDFIDTFWYPLFLKYDLQLVAIVVDKRYFNNEARREIPLEIAAKALFDQTETHPHKDCRIVFDQMDRQLRSSKNEQGKILRIANTRIELDDGRYEKKFHHTSVQFDKSCNSNFLQLADMVAYNTWRQFVDFGDKWDEHIVGDNGYVDLPEYEYFARISEKFYCSSNKMVSGVGLIKLPDPFNSYIDYGKWGIARGWRLVDENSKKHL